MYDNILIIGWYTQTYLRTIVDDLVRSGITCKITRQISLETNNDHYTLSIEDYTSIHMTVQCHCCELDPANAEAQILAYADLLRQAKHIVVVFPIKLFAGYRYNVDQVWKGIEDWITPDLLQRVIHHSIQETNATLSWVITGTEHVIRTLTNQVPIMGLSEICSAEDVRQLQQKAENVVKCFLCDNDEKVFLSQCAENEIVFLGFLRDSPASGIGEKVCMLWNVYAFWTSIQNTLPPEAVLARL